MKVKDEWKSWLKTQYSGNKDHGVWSYYFMANRWENNGNSETFYFGGLQNHCRWWLQPWNSKMLASWKESYDMSFIVQSLSHVRLFVTPWTAACQASLSFTISQSLLKLMSIESVMPSNQLIFCHTLLLLPSVFPSIRVFSNESALCIRWPKYWRFGISPSNEYSGLISFGIDWFDLLEVQGTLKSLLQ